MVDEQRDERGPVSWESFNWMRQEIARLTAEKVQLELDVEFWKRQTNHWYMKATYSPAEMAGFARKRAKLEMPPDPEGTHN